MNIYFFCKVQTIWLGKEEDIGRDICLLLKKGKTEKKFSIKKIPEELKGFNQGDDHGRMYGMIKGESSR